jgi:uncharacterized protein
MDQKISFVLFLLLASAQIILGQVVKPAVKVLAMSSGSSIKLRWAPNHAGAWHLANKFGYTIERILLTENNRFVPQQKITLNSSPILPAAEKIWNVYIDDDDYVAVAAQAILGSSFSVETGSSLTGLVTRATELDSRYSFTLFASDQSIKAAELSGLYYQDEKVSAGGKYLYRVYCNIPKEILEVDTGFVFIGIQDKVTLPKVKGLQIDPVNSQVILSWDGMLYSSFYNSFLVERSLDGGKTFKAVTNKPVVNTSKRTDFPARIYKSDSLVDTSTRHVYRVRGISAFGDKGPYSDTISAKALPPKLPTPAVRKFTFSSAGVMKLFWDYPAARIASLKCFEVHEYLGERRLRFLKGVSRDSTHTTLLLASPIYLLVRAVSTVGGHSDSFPFLINMPDTIPPSAPVGLSGSISDSGRVSLSWNGNSERDLFGYSVYRSNGEADFVMVSNDIITANEFFDTLGLNTLDEKIFYKIAAVDRHFNHSPMSDCLKLQKPDVIAPSSPVIHEVRQDSLGIHLTWSPGASNDVIKYILYLKSENDSEWAQHKIFDSEVSGWTDLPGRDRETRLYRLTALDDSGLESLPSTAVAVFIRGTTPSGISNSFATIDSKQKLVGLSWECPHKDVRAFLLYKSLNGTPLRLYRSLNASERTFTDRYSLHHKRIEYRLAVRDKNGVMSVLSKPLVVQP